MLLLSWLLLLSRYLSIFLFGFFLWHLSLHCLWNVVMVLVTAPILLLLVTPLLDLFQVFVIISHMLEEVFLEVVQEYIQFFSFFISYSVVSLGWFLQVSLSFSYF